jgi:SOS-response transcriptional repressor LexA
MELTINEMFVDYKRIVCLSTPSSGVNFSFMKPHKNSLTDIERIEQCLEESGLTAPELQGKLKIQSQHWNNWKNRGVPGRKLFLIAEILNVNSDWLATGKGEKYRDRVSANSNVDPGNIVRGDVPLINWEKASEWCKNGKKVDPEDVEKWMPCPIEHGGGTFALIVKGDTMTSPFPGQRSYPEGTVIFVDPTVKITNGCRVIALIGENKEITFKEYREDAGKMYLKPLNPQYQTQEIEDGTHFCGVIIGRFTPE